MKTYLSLFLLMVAMVAGAQVTTFPSNVTVMSRLNVATNGYYRYDGVDMLWGDKITHNWFLGYAAGKSGVTGVRNTGLGFGALNQIGAGEYNTALGASTLGANTSGSRNTAGGFGAGTVSVIANDTTAFGYGALEANLADSNTGIGSGAVQRNTIGTFNLGVGVEALNRTIMGSLNTAVGSYDAMLMNISGSNNSSFGYGNMYSTTNGQANSSFGALSYYYKQTGDANIGIGYRAGMSNVIGSSNILIGSYIQTPLTNSSQRLNIGNAIIGDLISSRLGIGRTENGGYSLALASNLLLPSAGKMDFADGNAYVKETGNSLRFATWTGAALTEKMAIMPDGKVGIGTMAPSSTLDVTGGVRAASAIITNMVGSGDHVAVNSYGLLMRTNITGSGGGGVGPTNANQFGASLTLSLKDGIVLTNLGVWGTLSANGPIVVESANSISWGDGSVTVLGDSGADYISLGTGSAERLRVIANGNVGIGTLTPGSILSVSNAVGGAGTPIFHAGTNNTGNGLLVSSNGNVAVGSRVPSAQLDVPGEGRFGTMIATNATVPTLNTTTLNANTLNLTNALGSNQVRLAITNLTDVSVPGRVEGDTLLWNPTMFKYTNGQSPGGFSVSGNSNQIPYLNVAGTGFLFNSHDKSAPGFGFQRSANGNIGAMLIHVDKDEDIGLVQIGPPNPASNISGFVPSLSITNRYAGDGQTTQEMVRVNFVDVDSGSSAESFIQTWRSWVSGTPPASTLVSYAAALRKDGQLMVAHGVFYPSNSLANTMPTAAQLGPGGIWVGNSNASYVAIKSANGSTTAMTVLVP